MTETEFQQRAGELIEAGRMLYAWGMVPATSGNFSARLSSGELAITVSGSHKGRLDETEIMRVDVEGRSLDGRRPSAETPLHVQVYKHFPNVRAVLHPHSVNATLLSRQDSRHVVLKDYELLKAFPSVDTHACGIVVPNIVNDQDIGGLAAQVAAYMDTNTPVYGYLPDQAAGHCQVKDFDDIALP